MINCITGNFNFCSVESIPTKYFNVVFFFFATMLLIAKCNRLIMTLNKCVLKKKIEKT